MLKKYIYGVALAMLVSGLSFGDIQQQQGFSIGLAHDMLLGGGLGTTGNTNMLLINLGQSMSSALGRALDNIALTPPSSGLGLLSGLTQLQLGSTTPGGTVQMQGFGTSATQTINGFVAGTTQTQ